MNNKRAAGSPKIETGISGLDHVLHGGLPPNRIYLVEGAPGSGKTTMALQFLLTGVAKGERCLYISLSETRDEIEEVARSHDWSLDGLDIIELSSLDEKIAAEAESTLFRASEAELTETTRYLLEGVDKLKPKRLGFDSLSELRLLSQTPLRYRRQILALKQYLSGRQCTTLLLDDTRPREGDAHVESLAHGVISLDQLAPEFGSSRRRLLIQKVRGSNYRGGNHDFVIRTGGLVIFPRLIAAEHHQKFKAENISSGVKGLDDLLGGGLARGTSNLFTGPPGSGKSTLALKYALAAAERKEKVLLFTFDESLSVLHARAHGLGLPLAKLVERGMIRTLQVDPAEMTPGELACKVQEAVEKDHVRFVCFDSLNGYLHAMGDDRFLNLQLHELLTYLNQRGIVTILVLSPQGFLGQMQSPIDLTYLADAVVALRFFEADGAVHKAISVIKKRIGPHEPTIRELRIDPAGISVSPPLTKFRGILTGIPVTAETIERKKRATRARKNARRR